MYFLKKMVIFHGYVSLPEGSSQIRGQEVPPLFPHHGFYIAHASEGFFLPESWGLRLLTIEFMGVAISISPVRSDAMVNINVCQEDMVVIRPAMLDCQMENTGYS